MSGAKTARPNHSYGPAVKLKWAKDEYLCPVRLIKEYIAKTKDREDESKKLVVKRKTGPAVAVSWLDCQLVKRNLDPSQDRGLWRVSQESCCDLCIQSRSIN